MIFSERVNLKSTLSAKCIQALSMMKGAAIAQAKTTLGEAATAAAATLSQHHRHHHQQQPQQNHSQQKKVEQGGSKRTRRHDTYP